MSPGQTVVLLSYPVISHKISVRTETKKKVYTKTVFKILDKVISVSYK